MRTRAAAASLTAFIAGVVLGGLGAYKGRQIAREVPKRDGSGPPIPRRATEIGKRLASGG